MQASSLMPSPLSQSDSLITAIFIAVIVHAFILLGITFSAPEKPKIDKSIDITLSTAPVKKAPKDAKFLAPDHQLGAGEETRKPEPPPLTPPGQNAKSETQIAPRPIEPKPANEIRKEPAKLQEKPVAAPKVLTQKAAPDKIQAEAKEPDSADLTSEPVQERPRLSAEALQAQIAQLGEKYRNNQLSSQNTKIKFVNSLSAHKYLAAQYIKDWEDKVERTGNLNYPDIARNKGFSETLTMDVGINADGSIYSIRIAKSSGNPALDEAAKRIVKMSAPFAALPDELLRELDVLVITRVWKFSDESGMTTR